MDNEFAPREEETLGDYLKRLRAEASRIQGRNISQDSVAAEVPDHLPPFQRFTGAWLSITESDSGGQPSETKLRTLAAVYSRLLRTRMPPEWFLAKAGFVVDEPPDPMEEPRLVNLLRNEDVLALLAAVSQLIELGYEDDVKLLTVFATRYLQARDPEARAGDIFDDPRLSRHIQRYMKVLGLIET
jgi:hypothetical protein